jgi:hypothetical protein
MMARRDDLLATKKNRRETKDVRKRMGGVIKLKCEKEGRRETVTWYDREGRSFFD